MPDNLTLAFSKEWIRNFERRLQRSSFLDADQKLAVQSLFFQAMAVASIEVMGSQLLEALIGEVKLEGR